MNSKIDNMIFQSLRRLSGLALVLAVTCSSAMAGGKGSTTTDQTSEIPFTLDYACSAGTYDLDLVGDDIPVDKVFEVKYVSGSLMRSTNGDIGNPAVAVWGYDDQSFPLLIATQPTPYPHMAQMNQNLSVTFYTAPSSVSAHGMPTQLPYSAWCHVRFHGVLKNP